MSNQEIIKDVFKEGDAVASIIKKETSARIMVKGIEPADDGFLKLLTDVVAASRQHLEGIPRIDLVAVLVSQPGSAEKADVSAAQGDPYVAVPHIPGRAGMRLALEAFRGHGADERAAAAAERSAERFYRLVEDHAGDRKTLMSMLGPRG